MKCPGQDTQYWNADAIFETQCPECGHPMEFFKDDTTRRCMGCQKKIVNPNMDFGCASYCKFAEACLGTLPEEFVSQQDDLLKDRVAVEMKRYFKTDFKRIGHASKVARFAEKLGKKEKANLAVVLCAAYLYDIGAGKAVETYGEEAYNSNPGKYKAQEGPPVAREILEGLRAKPPIVDAVCDILACRHSPDDGRCDTIDYKIVHDADMLTHMMDCGKGSGLDPDEFSKKINRIFTTESGRKLAKDILIKAE